MAQDTKLNLRDLVGKSPLLQILNQLERPPRTELHVVGIHTEAGTKVTDFDFCYDCTDQLERSSAILVLSASSGQESKIDITNKFSSESLVESAPNVSSVSQANAMLSEWASRQLEKGIDQTSLSVHTKFEDFGDESSPEQLARNLHYDGEVSSELLVSQPRDMLPGDGDVRHSAGFDHRPLTAQVCWKLSAPDTAASATRISWQRDISYAIARRRSGIVEPGVPGHGQSALRNSLRCNTTRTVVSQAEGATLSSYSRWGGDQP